MTTRRSTRRSPQGALTTTRRQGMRNVLGPRPPVSSTDPRQHSPAPQTERPVNEAPDPNETDPRPASAAAPAHPTRDTPPANKQYDPQSAPLLPGGANSGHNAYQERKTRAKTALQRKGTFKNWAKIEGITAFRSQAAEESMETKERGGDKPPPPTPAPQVDRAAQIRQQARFAYLAKTPLSSYPSPSRRADLGIPTTQPTHSRQNFHPSSAAALPLRSPGFTTARGGPCRHYATQRKKRGVPPCPTLGGGAIPRD